MSNQLIARVGEVDGESTARIERTRDPYVAGAELRRDIGDQFDADAMALGRSSSRENTRTMLAPSRLAYATRTVLRAISCDPNATDVSTSGSQWSYFPTNRIVSSKAFPPRLVSNEMVLPLTFVQIPFGTFPICQKYDPPKIGRQIFICNREDPS